MTFLKKNFTVITLSAICLSLFFFSSCNSKKRHPSYRLDLVYSNGEICGKLGYKFVNSYNNVFNSLIFSLRANAYKEGANHPPVSPSNTVKAYPYGQSFGECQIYGVKVEGQTADYEIFGDDGEFLKIYTGEIYENQSKEVEIEFKTVIPKSILRLGETDQTVNLGDFFPILCGIENGSFQTLTYHPFGDSLFSQVADYTVNLTLPSQFSVASSGSPTKTQITEHGTTYSYELNSGRDFAFVISKNFEIRSVIIEDLTVNYYSLGGDCEQKLSLAKDCLQFFTKTFGAIPYKSVSIAETPFINGGMEYSGLCMLSNCLSEEDFKYSLYHELAHQWWYGGVGNNQFSCAYIDEGLAEYSTYLYLLEKEGESVANTMIDNAKCAYKSFFDINSLLSGSANTTMNRTLSEFSSEYEYINIAYNKSLLAFYNYGVTVGKNKAVKNLKKLYKDNYLGEIGLGEIITALGHGEHFKSFVEGKVII